ncbi:triose-phosphate isomerase [Maritimibacter sp. DP1N21-5]|uniref:triose-phosphate isomerase n=1 Tax=Maritimibacter sp. DP1N21-5 TaxID=2836867 RepID=UPI001C48A188|nr:triose-phosphate isomerase [Maritimibacter sp. DP1N21-5]MBV7409723.1 triose-phosphate isomerase [Maritimibacter sp. DP1N21-5]
MRRKLAAGNWKMNGTKANIAVIRDLAQAHPSPMVDVLICPPATLVAACAGHAPVAIGGQDCHAAAKGAHTGDISAPMLADAGATHVILGHSERRVDHGETDELVAAKAEAAMAARLVPVVCCGESLDEREEGMTLDVIGAQLAGSIPNGADGSLIVAYEPIWAIGTGKVPTLEQIAEVHDFMRRVLVDRFGAAGDEMRLLYGGSVKSGNAAEIFAVGNVDGALVGGASLQVADFSPIITALEAS